MEQPAAQATGPADPQVVHGRNGPNLERQSKARQALTRVCGGPLFGTVGGRGLGGFGL